ncbi:D-Ala-D-Ala carboxypeptidase family metallohydrolase [Desulfofalx alkaliphila]|uniref:D-Ala-D-Ala carboxypeptidase family metallohydrolase n=1 Tax=Desulfofalx alkaliphila TaxID=105483 RepID=UPI001EE45C74|nr:D-Ala-D-Ala carboxypeptidase family metallohydrolase [Desulfofalx alkaliphila]
MGSKGSEVVELQRQLAAAGFKPGPADGIFGPLTKDAVLALQGYCGLSMDGIVGEESRRALQLLGGGPAVQKRRLTANFKEGEFACPCCGRLKINIRLVHLLERLRSGLGNYPVVITSGYRCPQHNRRVGGATGSEHVLGNAADIRVQGTAPEKVASAAEGLGFPGVGRYSSFTHVDVRLGHLARWRG